MENVNIEESHSQAQDQYTLKGVANDNTKDSD
jgi:hypothetical protein